MNPRQKTLISSGIKLLSDQANFKFNDREIEKHANVSRGTLLDLFETRKVFLEHCFLSIFNDIFDCNEVYVKKIEQQVDFKEIRACYKMYRLFCNKPLVGNCGLIQLHGG
jgi:hypothetical protein